VLLASGSSWRNFENNIEYYDATSPPKTGPGLFNRSKDPFADANLESYYSAVNKAGLYDPSTNEFFRVPHPVPVANPDNLGHFVPSVLFCSGDQIQLPGGNALFFGGMQYYTPQRTGTASTYIYNWVEDATKDWSTVDWTVNPGNTADNP
jgi:hypothetical protein